MTLPDPIGNCSRNQQRVKQLTGIIKVNVREQTCHNTSGTLDIETVPEQEGRGYETCPIGDAYLVIILLLEYFVYVVLHAAHTVMYMIQLTIDSVYGTCFF
ncbi:hypothetical protein ACJX0J_013341, partial [Zea mays]